MRKTISIKKIIYVLNRDKNICQYCGKKGVRVFRWGKPCVVENPNRKILKDNTNYNDRDLIPFEIDHIISVHYGGTNKVNNLTLSCQKCNRKKGRFIF